MDVKRRCFCPNYNDRVYVLQGVCTEAGMYALRERRVHVTQEDFELAVAKVGILVSTLLEPRHLKTGFLLMPKQKCRSAVQATLGGTDVLFRIRVNAI